MYNKYKIMYNILFVLIFLTVSNLSVFVRVTKIIVIGLFVGNHVLKLNLIIIIQIFICNLFTPYFRSAPNYS
jgi:hypothetical protein